MPPATRRTGDRGGVCRSVRQLKLLLIVAYLLCDHGAITARVASLGVSPALAVYLALLGLLSAALILAGWIRPTPVRVAVAAVLCCGSVFQQSIEWSTGGVLTYDGFINMLAARGNIGEAYAQHGGVLRQTVAAALLLFVGLTLPPRGRRIPAWLAPAAPAAALALLAAMLFQRGGEGSGALPAAFTPVAYAALLGMESLVQESGPRRDVALARRPGAVDRDVVLIVDESIAGNYLDINNPAGVPTGLGDPHPGVAITNYGYAASIHTCSATSNLALRYGGTRERYQDTIAHYPSIWRYAHRAGLRTVYIDAQSTGGHLQNLMTAAERAEIDDFIQFDDVPVVDRDMAIADLLAARINDGRHEFIYINKAGAHFPLSDKYPDRLLRYRPALPRGHQADVSWTSDRTGFTGSPHEWVLYRNSYRNTLLWSVGSFFERLLARADLSRATLIYTSDHGQDLHERGNPGNNTHCGTNPALAQEGLVPLLVMEGAAQPSRDWTRNLAANRNGMSHFRIFPTLLELMGYDAAAARPVYGAPLDDPAPDAFSFNMLFNTRLGRRPEWQRIDLSRIITPPVSDFAAQGRAQLARRPAPAVPAPRS